MEKANAHVPIEQFGFILVHPESTVEEIDSLIENYNYAKQAYKKSQEPRDLTAPFKLGEVKTENGHTYEAVMNEGEGKLYWLIKKS